MDRSRLPWLALAGLLAAIFISGGGAAAAAKRPEPVAQVKRAGERAYIADRLGRELLLRGINSNALAEYPDYFQQTVPLGRSDIDEMAALGFNFLRLPINWSRLAPQPGQFSDLYLDQIKRVLGWAQAAGMWVLVDFHQDRYNRNLRPGDEADGAPDWATFTDGQPCYESFLLSPCSMAALDAFWENREAAGKPLQQHYLEALVKVSRTLRGYRRLLGIEIMNEPTFGSSSSPRFEREQLWPFNRSMIAGLRRAGERRPIWFGPNLMRDAFDFDVGEPERFSDDRNLVYAPHVYTGVFNSGGIPELEASYAAAEREARIYGAAWVDAEWGAGSDEKAEAMRARKLDLQDEYRVGSGFWMWKQRPGFYNWQTVEVDGSLRQDSMRAQMLSRPHADVVPGRIRSTSYEDGRLRVSVAGRGGMARLWSGTVVRRGGANLLPQPLTRAFVDGRRVRAVLRPKAFETESASETQSVSLRGFRVFVKLKPGRHEIELRPGNPRLVKGRWR